jgi:hypothetical protein
MSLTGKDQSFRKRATTGFYDNIKESYINRLMVSSFITLKRGIIPKFPILKAVYESNGKRKIIQKISHHRSLCW